MDDPFATSDTSFEDWLQDPLTTSSYSLSSIFAQDPLAPFQNSNDKFNNPAGGGAESLEALFGTRQEGGGADGSTLAQGDVGRSEGTSPAQGSAYSYTSSSMGDTSFASLTSGTTAPSIASSSELDSLFSSVNSSAPPAPSQSAAYPYGMVEQLAAIATFDTTALQSLFADPPPQIATSSSTPPFGLSPYPAGSFPLQTLSPAPSSTTSTSPFSPAMNAFSPLPSSQNQHSSHGIFLATPSASSGSASSVASPSQQAHQSLAVPRLSFDFGAPGPVPSSSSNTAQGLTFGAFQASQSSTNGVGLTTRPRTSLAATAGVTLPPSLLMQPSSHPSPIGMHSAQQSYTLRADPLAPLPLAMLQGQPEHVQPQALAPQGGMGRRTPSAAGPGQQQKAHARNSVEVLANAGIQGPEVYQSPLLRLHPNFVFPPFAGDHDDADFNQPAMKVEEQEDAPPADPAATTMTKVGRALKGKAAAAASAAQAKKQEKDKGHNAVEQKYRNSINNALATLRDEIPALQHLKPLPSMPPSRRKASQFTLTPAAVTHLVTPTGLVDGIAAAKTLSKGTILQKAIEYIVFLRSARDGLEEDLKMMKELVDGSVEGGEVLTREWERRRAINEARREREREERAKEDAAAEEGAGEEDGEEEEDEPAPVTTKGKRAAAGSKKRGASSLSATASAAAPAGKKARLPSQHISPALTSNYSRVQALNAAHLEALAASQQQQQEQHAFPPSPASSGENGVSPGAIMGGANGSPPRILLASFMGLSFAGGTAYDWASSAATAEEAAAGAVARAWTSRLVRRAAFPDPSAAAATTDAGLGLVDLFHPSLLGGLVALGLASIVVSLVWLVYPLFASSASTSYRRPHPSTSATPSPAVTRSSRRRTEALAALAALNSSSTNPDGSVEPETYASARTKALQARRQLLKLAGAPGTVGLISGLAKEGAVYGMRELVGVRLSRSRGMQEDPFKKEQAIAWVRIAEIEASLGDRIPYLSRCYTFLRLSNFSHSSSWPSTAPSPSTSRASVNALLAIHLLSRGHLHWAEALWNSMLASGKKTEAACSADASSGFADIAISSAFATVQALLDPASRPVKEDAAFAAPSDTVPLLVLAEATCEDALRDVWQTLFIAVAAMTTSPGQVTAPPLDVVELRDTIDSVCLSTIEGSEVHDLAAMSKVFLACYLAGTSKTGGDSSAAAASTRDVFLRLAREYRQSSTFSRLSCARPFLQLFLPVFAPSSSPSALFGIDESAPTVQTTNEVDLLATTTLEWLLVRRAGAAAVFEHQRDEEAEGNVKVNPTIHSRALAVRRLLGHHLFQSLSPDDAVADEAETDRALAVAMEDAKDALVDALTKVARRAAGLKGGLWDEEDSGVDLEG
ncbi:hypothetical protein JCM11251_001015 [Rhodosporidiobolus azoricus]